MLQTGPVARTGPVFMPSDGYWAFFFFAGAWWP